MTSKKKAPTENNSGAQDKTSTDDTPNNTREGSAQDEGAVARLRSICLTLGKLRASDNYKKKALAAQARLAFGWAASGDLGVQTTRACLLIAVENWGFDCTEIIDGAAAAALERHRTSQRDDESITNEERNDAPAPDLKVIQGGKADKDDEGKQDNTQPRPRQRPSRAKKPLRAEMDENGLWLHEVDENGRTGKRTEFRVCPLFHVVGKVMTENDEQHSLLIEWKTRGGYHPPPKDPRDMSGKELEEWTRLCNATSMVHRMIVSAGELHSNTMGLIGRLSEAGLIVTHNRTAREKFAEYLSPHFDSIGLKKITLLLARGWSPVDGHLVFAHEFGTIKTDPSVEVILKNDDLVLHGRQGTFEQWQQRVGNPAGKHQLMIVALSVAACGPLIKLMGASLFGVHFWGPTSKGKTTLLCTAASFYGDGDEHGRYIQPWTSTINSLEKRLELASDTLLPIDDLGAADPYPFFSALYRLFNGVGRGRLTSSAQLREQSTWATPVISTGEIRPQDKLEEIRNRKQTGGQEVRMIALHVVRDGFAHGAFDTPESNAEAAALSKAIRKAARECYGTAGPVYVERLAMLGDREKVISDLIDEFLAPLPHDMSAEVRRVADHFALLAAAGELLIKLQIVDWPKGTACDACRTAFDSWVADRGAVSATHAHLNAVELLRHAVTVHAAHFRDADHENSFTPNPQWGYFSIEENNERGDEVWFEKAALKEIFVGQGERNAIDGLRQAGLLQTTQGSAKTSANQVWRTPKGGKQRMFYVVSLDKLHEAKSTSQNDKTSTQTPNQQVPVDIDDDIPF
jgi:hypothetical protein